MTLVFQNGSDYTNGMNKPIKFTGSFNVEYTEAEVEYLEWVGKTIKEQQTQLDAMLEALKDSRDLILTLWINIDEDSIEKRTLGKAFDIASQAIALAEGTGPVPMVQDRDLFRSGTGDTDG